MWVKYNPSPVGAKVGDCSVRAITAALGIDWESAYVLLCNAGFQMADMPSSNAVISAVLRKHGFYRKAIPDTCPNCYTVRDFCREYSKGVYVLGTGSHVVTVIDGDYYDSWDSGDEIPQYYWEEM